MEISFIITLVFILALIFIIFKIIKVFIRAFIVISVLLIVGLVIFSLLVHSDAMKLNNELRGENLILLSNSLPDYKSIITGFKTEPENETGFKVLNNDELSRIKSMINNDEFENLKKEENISRIFIVNESILEYDVKVENMSFTKEQGLSVLHSNDAISEFSIIMEENEGVDKNMIESGLRKEKTNDELKSEVFALMFSASLEKNPLLLIEGYKSKEVWVIPKTILFKVMDFIPINAVKNLMKEKIPLNQTD